MGLILLGLGESNVYITHLYCLLYRIFWSSQDTVASSEPLRFHLSLEDPKIIWQMYEITAYVFPVWHFKIFWLYFALTLGENMNQQTHLLSDRIFFNYKKTVYLEKKTFWHKLNQCLKDLESGDLIDQVAFLRPVWFERYDGVSLYKCQDDEHLRESCNYCLLNW